MAAAHGTRGICDGGPGGTTRSWGPAGMSACFMIWTELLGPLPVSGLVGLVLVTWLALLAASFAERALRRRANLSVDMSRRDLASPTKLKRPGWQWPSSFNRAASAMIPFHGSFTKATEEA